jgi:hypothetical protein
MIHFMEYIQPEPDPRDGPAPVLEYAAPRMKPALRTPFYVRVIGLAMSAFGLLLGLLLVWGAIDAWIDWVKRWKNGDIPSDVIRFFVAGGILITVGIVGIRAAFRFKNISRQGR